MRILWLVLVLLAFGCEGKPRTRPAYVTAPCPECPPPVDPGAPCDSTDDDDDDDHGQGHGRGN